MSSDIKRFAAVKRDGDPGTTIREAYTAMRAQGLPPIEEGVIWSRSGSTAWMEKEPCATSRRLELSSVVREVEVKVYDNEGNHTDSKTINRVVRYEPINANLRDYTNRSLFDKADGLARQAMDFRDPNRNVRKHRFQGALAAIYGTIERTMSKDLYGFGKNNNQSENIAEIFCEMAEKAITDINNFSNGTAGQIINELTNAETDEARQSVWRKWFKMMDKIYRRCGAPEAKLDEMDTNHLEDLASALGVPHWYVETYRQQMRRRQNGTLTADFLDRDQEEELTRSISCFVEDEEFEKKLDDAGRAGSYIIPFYQSSQMRKPTETSSVSFMPTWCVDFETKQGIRRREFVGTYEELLTALAKAVGSYSNLQTREVVFGMNPKYFKKKTFSGPCPHCYGSRTDIKTKELVGKYFTDLIEHCQKVHNVSYDIEGRKADDVCVARTQRGLTTREPAFEFRCDCKYPKTFDITGQNVAALANTPDDWKVGYDKEMEEEILAKDKKEEIAGYIGEDFVRYVNTLAAETECSKCGKPHSYHPKRRGNKAFWTPMMSTIRDLRLKEFEVVIDDTKIIDCQDDSYINGYCEIINGVPFVEEPDWLASNQSVEAWMYHIQTEGDLTKENAQALREKINERFKNNSKARFVLHTWLNANIRGRIMAEANQSKVLNEEIKPILRQITLRNFHDISRQVNTQIRESDLSYPERTYAFSFLKSMRALLKAEAIEIYLKDGLSERGRKTIDGIKKANYVALRYKYSTRIYQIIDGLMDWEVFLIREAIRTRQLELKAYATPTETRKAMWNVLQSRSSDFEIQNVLIAAQLVGDRKLEAVAHKKLSRHGRMGF